MPKKQKQDPTILIVCIAAGGVILIAASVGIVFLLLYFSTSESFPITSSQIQTGEELSKETEQTIRRICKLEPDETIVYYYREGDAPAEEMGEVITDKRVLSYEYDYEMFVYYLTYEEIQGIKLINPDEIFEERVYFLQGEHDDQRLALSASDSANQKVLNYIQEKAKLQDEAIVLK